MFRETNYGGPKKLQFSKVFPKKAGFKFEKYAALQSCCYFAMYIWLNMRCYDITQYSLYIEMALVHRKGW